MADLLVLPPRGPGRLSVGGDIGDLLLEALDAIGTSEEEVKSLGKQIIKSLSQIKDVFEAFKKGIPPFPKDQLLNDEQLARRLLEQIEEWTRQGVQVSEWRTLVLWSPSMGPDP